MRDPVTDEPCEPPPMARPLEDIAKAWEAARPATKGDLDRVEAKLDALIVALKAGAIGKWTP